MKNLAMTGLTMLLVGAGAQADLVTYQNLGTLGYADPANPGHAYFERAEQVSNIVQHSNYTDCVAPTSIPAEEASSYLIWKAAAADGMKIDSLNVWLYFSGDAQNSGHIKVSYSTSLGGSWTEIGDAYVPGAYAWYDGTSSATGLNAGTYYIKCEIDATWVNHAGNANLWWKGFSLTGNEAVVPEPISMTFLGLGALFFLRRRK